MCGPTAPTFDQTMNDGQGGYICGCCGSADYWMDHFDGGVSCEKPGCHTPVPYTWAARMYELDL